ncbi:MAG: tetratricopeptide repeat protein [Spirochaetota bacterium]
MKKRTALIISFFILMTTSGFYGYPESYIQLMSRGNHYFKNELYREALAYFTRGKDKNEGSFVPHFNCGTASYKLEDYTGAIEYFTEALKHTDDEEITANIYYNLGNSYFKLGEFDRAIEQYKLGLEKNPYNLNMKYNLELALKKKIEQSKQYPLSGDMKEDEGKNAKTGAEQKKNENTEEKLERLDRTAAVKGLQVEPSGERELTRREAEQLIHSINEDQSGVMRDMIKKRLGTSQHEKDW